MVKYQNMRKIFLILFCMFFSLAFCETLKGGVYEEYIPKGFFGSWGVISKMKSSTNPAKFNYESKDIWVLSGSGNVLTLQNLESGANSEIIIREKSLEGKTLRFERQKTINLKNGKQIQKESVEFVLQGKNFSGTDKFSIENYDKNNNFINADSATYIVEGVRISGE